MGFKCDTCKYAKPATKHYWQTDDGKMWNSSIEYVRCAMTKRWTIEKRTYCPVYEQKGGES